MDCKFCASKNTKLVTTVGFMSNELAFVDKGSTLFLCLKCGKISTEITEQQDSAEVEHT